MLKALIIFILFVGILFVVIEVTRINAQTNGGDPHIIFKYIPRTFEEEMIDPVPVSDIFETMFSQPSPWVGSIRTYDRRKQERINKYFVTQL